MNAQPVEPIVVIDLFPQERELLLELFAELTDEDWLKPTVCPGWTVRDIGLHLLGDDIGYLSGNRDGFSNPFFANKNMEQWESLVENINEANELWVRAAQRVSPALLSALPRVDGQAVLRVHFVARSDGAEWRCELGRAGCRTCLARYCQRIYGKMVTPAADTRRGA